MSICTRERIASDHCCTLSAILSTHTHISEAAYHIILVHACERGPQRDALTNFLRRCELLFRTVHLPLCPLSNVHQYQSSVGRISVCLRSPSSHSSSTAHTDFIGFERIWRHLSRGRPTQRYVNLDLFISQSPSTFHVILNFQ